MTKFFSNRDGGTRRYLMPWKGKSLVENTQLDHSDLQQLTQLCWSVMRAFLQITRQGRVLSHLGRMMRTSRHNLGDISPLEKTRGFYVVLVLSRSLYFYFVVECIFLYIISLILSFFSPTSVVRRESSFCKSIYR